MLNIGLAEMIMIMALALVVIGPDRLPEVMRFLGRQYGRLMRASNELRRAFVLEAEAVEVERRAEELRKRREEARRRLQAQRDAAQSNDRDDPLIAPVPQEPRLSGVTLIPPQDSPPPPAGPEGSGATLVPPAPEAEKLASAGSKPEKK